MNPHQPQPTVIKNILRQRDTRLRGGGGGVEGGGKVEEVEVVLKEADEVEEVEVVLKEVEEVVLKEMEDTVVVEHSLP